MEHIYNVNTESIRKMAYGVYDNSTTHTSRQFGAGTNIVGVGATSSTCRYQCE